MIGYICVVDIACLKTQQNAKHFTNLLAKCCRTQCGYKGSYVPITGNFQETLSMMSTVVTQIKLSLLEI